MFVRKWIPLSLISLLFLLASMACSLGRFVPDRSVAVPERTVVVSQESADEARQIITDSASNTTIRMNETQFTSLIASELAKNQADSPLTNVTAWFETGQVVIEGDLREGVLPMSGRLVVRGDLAAQDGAVVFSVNEASVGGIKLPGMAVDLLNDQIDSALAEVPFNQFPIRSVTLEPGLLTIEKAE